MNGGKDVKIGDDKRPIRLVPSNEQYLYNIRNGELLLDEYSNPLITNVDTYYLPDTTMANSTSIVFDDKNTPYVGEDHSYIGIATGYYATHADLDADASVGINTDGQVTVLQATGINVAVAETGVGTVLQVDGNRVTWCDLTTVSGITTSNTWPTGGAKFTARSSLSAAPLPIVKTVDDLGTKNNIIYFDYDPDDIEFNDEDVVGIGSLGATVGDYVIGEYVPPGTMITEVTNNSRLVLSNKLTNVGIQTAPVIIRRHRKSIKTSDTVWKIEEQFAETSEVSSTLLGVTRAETQLSLFSNVSSYGLDDDEFEQFNYVGGHSHSTWDGRENKFYGKRYNAKITEETSESGIQLQTFSVPYSFPFGPGYTRAGLYNEDSFNAYRNFIQMGNDLYDIFNDGSITLDAPYGSWPSDFENNFLNKELATNYVSAFGADVRYTTSDDPEIRSRQINIAFEAIDNWTDTWINLKRGTFTDPLNPAKGLTFSDMLAVIDNYNLKKGTSLINSWSQDNTRPGYDTNHKRYSQLQSRRVFRYQPGRISGFTFGVKSSDEPLDGSGIEWGIANPSDEYVFRVNKGNLSIVRRSTIPLDINSLSRSGLTGDDQKRVSAGGVGGGNPKATIDPITGLDYDHWVTEIPSDKFNGDPLTGNGPSEYNLSIPNVTMYKIEFGWYGAIGARFYAYIPTGNGDARWVVLHTLVIENSIGQPNLQDSYFRLIYRINITNNEFLRTPQYITKYGASYYIDGGDEGTSQMYTASTDLKSVTGITTESMLIIKPKEFIQNSLGTNLNNRKIIIPTKLNVSAGALTQLKISTCKGCPGFGHVYTPGLTTGVNGRTLSANEVQFTSSSTMVAVNGGYFLESDVGAKIIAPSINNAYIKSVSTPGATAGQFLSAVIEGFTGTINLNLGTREVAGIGVKTYNKETQTSGSIALNTDYPHPIRLSQYSGLAASNFAFTGTEITIQFANPNTKDSSGYGHWADFLIGVTDVEPEVTAEPTVDATAEITGWNRGGTSSSTIPTNSEILFGEHTHSWEGLNEEGVGQGEEWGGGGPGVRMGIDYRIPYLAGPGGGICSKVTIKVDEPDYQDNFEFLESRELVTDTGDVIGTGPSQIAGSGIKHYIQRKNVPFPFISNYDGGEVVVKTINTGVIDPTTGSDEILATPTGAVFVGTRGSYKMTATGGVGQDTYYYIEISSAITAGPTGISLAFRPVRLTGGFTSSSKLFKYNPFPLYFIAKMRDSATINDISIKEITGRTSRTVAPRLYFQPSTNTSITNASGKAVRGDAPPHFDSQDRLSSAEVDEQNQQIVREGSKTIDIVYVGANETKDFDLTRTFGSDRAVITPDNMNIEATLITARRIDDNAATDVQASITYKEQ